MDEIGLIEYSGIVHKEVLKLCRKGGEEHEAGTY